MDNFLIQNNSLKNEDIKEFIFNLKTILIQRYSIAELAKKVEVTPQTLYRLFKSEDPNPSLELLFKLMKQADICFQVKR